jgi:adenylate cyclase
VPLDTLGRALESMGFARMGPDEMIREDELEILPLLQLSFSSGILDLAWTARVGRAYAEGLRLLATAEHELYHARFELPLLASGADQRTAMEQAAQLSGDFTALVDRALMACYRRQQELAWTEHLVEHVEDELEGAGVLGRPGRVPAMCFLDLVGYTRLTEERGDAAATALAATLAVGYRTGGGGLVDSSGRLPLPAPTPTPGSRPTPRGDQPNSSRNPSRHDGYSRVSPNSDLALALLAARSWVP